MNGKQWLLLLVLVDFVTLSTWVLVEEGGLIGFYETLFASPAGVQVFFDIAIACTLAMIWMVRDARRRGASFAPYLLLTLVVGSIGPLLYLFVRERALARGRARDLRAEPQRA